MFVKYVCQFLQEAIRHSGTLAAPSVLRTWPRVPINATRANLNSKDANAQQGPVVQTARLPLEKGRSTESLLDAPTGTYRYNGTPILTQKLTP